MAKPNSVFLKELLKWQLLAIVIAFVWHLVVATGFWSALRVSFLITNSISIVIHGLSKIFHNKFESCEPSRLSRVIYWFVLIGGGTLAGATIGVYLVHFFVWEGFLVFYKRHFFRFLGFCLVVAVLVTVTELMFERLKANIAKKIKENEELKHLQVRTHLMALQSKINPHFLFNTLNTMLNLVHKHPDKVESMILNLSDIYRKVLQVPGDKNVSLKDEFELVKEYLEIEKIRMEERLTYNLHLEKNLEKIEIPPLLIEPLVENAVIHGISPKKEGGRIDVKAVKTVKDNEPFLRITIEDTGIGVGETRNPGNGFGMFSVQERMKLIYKDRGTFTISPGDECGTMVILEIPVEEKKLMIDDW